MKKTLLVSAIAALGLSSVALANGGMAAAPIATAATASDFTPGIYVGLQGGYADAGWESVIESEHLKHNETYAGRLFVGYDFHKYFAAEMGYMMLGQKAEVVSDGVKYSDVKTQAFDLVGKIKAPIMDNFGLFAKAGAGYLMLHKHEYTNDKSVNSDKLDLVYGFGAYYNFADNWTVDAAFTRYNSGETDYSKEKWQPVVDFYSVGISYKFNLPV